MIELSIPAVLGMVVVGLYNMMDSIFVGQMVGDVQMGAISVSYPLTLINAGSAAMLGVGSARYLLIQVVAEIKQMENCKGLLSPQ